MGLYTYADGCTARLPLALGMQLLADHALRGALSVRWHQAHAAWDAR